LTNEAIQVDEGSEMSDLPSGYNFKIQVPGKHKPHKEYNDPHNRLSQLCVLGFRNNK